MAFDPNLNLSGACKNPMSNVNDFSDWYQNEESFDLSSYMSNSGNLELCNDDLFQNLFPPNSPLGVDLKKENLDHFDDEEVESWYQNATSEPPSTCTSACSSAAPSPVPFNYYNTPPVTPQSERQRPTSPHHLQFDGLTTPMSTSRFAAIRTEDGNNNYMQMPQFQPEGKSEQSHNVVVKQEVDPESHLMQPPPLISIKKEQNLTTNPLIVDIHSSIADANQTNPSKQAVKRHASGNYSNSTKKSKPLLKGTDEYMEKRQRNNVAVRRSRDKAKIKALETQKKVDELSNENEKLHARVSELTHELSTLKNLLKSLPHVSA